MQGQQVPVNLWSREWDGVGTLGRSLSMGGWNQAAMEMRECTW